MLAERIIACPWHIETVPAGVTIAEGLAIVETVVLFAAEQPKLFKTVTE